MDKYKIYFNIFTIIFILLSLKFISAIFADNAGRAALGNTIYRQFPMNRGSVVIITIILLGLSYLCWKYIKHLSNIETTKNFKQEALLKNQAEQEKQRFANLRFIDRIDLDTIPTKKEYFSETINEIATSLKKEVLDYSKSINSNGFDSIYFDDKSSNLKGHVFNWKCYVHFYKNKWQAVEIDLDFCQTAKGIEVSLTKLCGMKENNDPADYPLEVSEVDKYGTGKHMISRGYSANGNTRDGFYNNTNWSDKYVDEVIGNNEQDYKIWRAIHGSANETLEHLIKIISSRLQVSIETEENQLKFSNA